VPGFVQIGAVAATTNAHNFHSIIPPDQQCDEDVPIDECDIGYVMNPNFVNSTEPWGMMNSLEWLAVTGVRK
jgi:hypothetical protein